ncbi:MAG: hypothetical protein F6K31_28350 [Symploca sp. SIO2G7]|nr:hypothetical protein [Symploca sp. SIO2G7]
MAFDVASESDVAAQLTQLKAFSCLKFRRIKVTREFWARELAVHRETIRRWEQNIIAHTTGLSFYYFSNRGQGLDSYQRFILCLIHQLKKNPNFSEREKTYLEVIDYFEGSGENGLPRWMGLCRDSFEQNFVQWQNNYN